MVNNILLTLFALFGLLIAFLQSKIKDLGYLHTPSHIDNKDDSKQTGY